MYDLEDLRKALEDLKRWNDAFADDRSNNPNKYRSQIRTAAGRVREIEAALKAAGKLPMTDGEKLTAELDKIFPNASSKTTVVREGKKYRIRYFPIQFSRSRKTVTEWGHVWEPTQ